MISNRKTILIIAGEFPPIKTIGRIRSVKFAEHLTQLGWKVIVLTVEPRKDSPIYISSLEAEVPEGVEVYRAPWPDIESETIDRIKRLLGYKSPTVQADASPVAASPESGRPSGNHPRASIFDLPLCAYKYLLRNWVNIPDDYRSWSRQALPLAKQICTEQQIDVVYTTLPPFSAARIGYQLQKELGIPWVVDYRDLWYGDVLREWINPLRERLELALERRYMKHANIIIGVSEQKTAFLKQLLKGTQARFDTLTNGYDPEIYTPYLDAPRAVNDTIDFVFTGRLFKNRRGYAFAEALGQLAQEQPNIKDKVRVHILGGVSPEIQQRYDEILTQYEINNIYLFPGDVPYDQAMRTQVNADYLLLIVDTGKTSDGVIPGKLFEYIAARRPIFALADPGATQEIIERAGIGCVVPAESVEQCKTALRRLLESEVPETLARDEDYLQQFERWNISQRLEKILRKTIGSGSEDSTG
ncbi:MAG: glycosyltransferase [Candidatus Polarisedimenticolaceae bacterium]|nr:glycosyltransferase [Candidatus Polarisedimenticolaceae bacterium]